LLLLDSGTSTQGSPVKPRGERGAQAIGDVAPIGHPAPLRTIVDIDLAQFDEVWAAGGRPHYVFPTSFDKLVRITGVSLDDVGPDSGRARSQ
jgi:hypothetical protein